MMMKLSMHGQSEAALAATAAPLPLPTSPWLTAEEAAEYLRVERRTLLLWARQGKIKGYILSGTKRRVWRFRQADLDAMLEVPSVRPERMAS
jgi:excisionase family DNA binding protein